MYKKDFRKIQLFRTQKRFPINYVLVFLVWLYYLNKHFSKLSTGNSGTS